MSAREIVWQTRRFWDGCASTRWKSRSVGKGKSGSWRMDETCDKVRDDWVYLYRWVGKTDKTVDCFGGR